jgi:ribose-phosphate pyrophosphokinase
VVLVDDVVSTGQTLLEAARQLRALGAESLSAPVAHALFIGDAQERLQEAGVHDICSTDSVCHRSNRIQLARLLAAVLADA